LRRRLARKKGRLKVVPKKRILYLKREGAVGVPSPAEAEALLQGRPPFMVFDTRSNELVPVAKLLVTPEPPAPPIGSIEHRLDTARLLGVGSRTPEQALQHFYAGLSPASMKAYEPDVVSLASFYKLEVVAFVREIILLPEASLNALAESWLESMKDLSPATRARRMAAFRRLGRSCGKRIDVQAPVPIHALGEGAPSAEDMAKLIVVLGERDRLLVVLIAALSLSTGDVCQLKVSDYDRERGVLKYARGVLVDGYSNVRLHEVQLSGALRSELDACTNDKSPEDPLFATSHGKPLSAAGIRFVFEQAGKKCGIRVRPQDLRRFADAQSGVPEVMKNCGFSNRRHLLIYDDNRMQRPAQRAAIVSDLLLGKGK
jgi:integrase